MKGGIAFKSTLKGLNAISSFFAWLAQTSFRDVWIHILTFLLLAVTIITAIVTAASNGGNVYTPQVCMLNAHHQQVSPCFVIPLSFPKPPIVLCAACHFLNRLCV